DSSVAQRWPLNAELLHPELESAAVEAQAPGRSQRARQYPTGLSQRRQNVGALCFFQCPLRTACLRPDAHVDLRYRHVQSLAGRSTDRPLDQVLQSDERRNVIWRSECGDANRRNVEPVV